MGKRLYYVECRGMHGKSIGTAHGLAYVVTDSPDSAYQTVRRALDKKGIGFEDERELDSVALIAEDALYPACRVRLYIARESDNANQD